jgi:uncharacterized RDD family membrane protein YckC
MTDSQLQGKRLAAAGIDVAILIALSIAQVILLSVAGCAAARWGILARYAVQAIGILVSIILLGYVLARDLIGGGRSLGKKLMNVRVLRVSGEPIDMMDSVKRNALFALPGALGVAVSIVNLIPCAACFTWPLWVLIMLISVGVLVWTIIDITQQPEGTHFGDRTAGTRVTW